MNKQKFFDKAKEIGLSTEEVEKQHASFSKLAQDRGMDKESAERWANIKTKGWLKKAARTPTVEVSGIMLGYRLTDWGQILRNKYGKSFPDDHGSRPGQPIPEHDYDLTMLIVDDSGKLSKVSYRSEKAVDYEVEVDKRFKAKLVENYRKDGYYFNDEITKIEYGESVDRETIIKAVDKEYRLENLSDLETVEFNVPFLVKADIIVDMRNVFGDDFIVQLDDAELDQDALPIEVRISDDLIDFSRDAENAVFAVEVYRVNQAAIHANAYNAWVQKDQQVKPEPIEDDTDDEDTSEFI